MSARTTLARQLWFVGPRRVEIRQVVLPAPGPGDVLVAVERSALSAGTELLVYRGELPDQLSLDASLTALQQHTAYPLRYGYSSVGRVTALGPGVDADWLGRRVFAFQPHASHFLCSANELVAVPEDITGDQALLLPNMETAINLVHDGNPRLGERVVVLGQGIVGLLLTALLARHPLQELVVVDAQPARRQQALRLGASQALDPADVAAMQGLRARLQTTEPAGADLLFEVSGSPAVLNDAVDLSGYTSRLVIGSWYGSKSAPLQLGGAAHRNRLRILTSQVSSIDPLLLGRWNKARRFTEVWAQLRTLETAPLITHRVALQAAPALYQQLDVGAADLVQAVFDAALTPS